MPELTEEVEEKLLDISIELSNIESLSRVVKICFEYGENLKKGDVEIAFEVLIKQITAIKNDFNEIETILKI